MAGVKEFENQLKKIRMGNGIKQEVTYRDVSRDASFKRFFSRRSVLAAIVKESIPEFQDMEFKDVVDCIVPSEDDPEFAKKLSEEITEFGNKILLDIIFECRLNSGIESTRLIIDLEMQRKYNVEYPLIKRGVYYAAELLARQLANNAYGNLVPVYSIWISRFGVKKELQNTVTRFRMSAKNSNNVDVSDLEKLSRLINIDLITLSPDYDWDTDDDAQVKFLQAIFQNRFESKEFNPYVEVTDNMANEIYTIKTKEDEYRHELELERDEGLRAGRDEGLRAGREEGLRAGRDEGLRAGREEGSLLQLISMVLKQQERGRNVSEIADRLDVEFGVVDKIVKISHTLNTQDPEQVLVVYMQEE